MDNLTQIDNATAEPAEAVTREEAAAELGKFKDVKALLDAYNSLQAEFTRRSQRLKELENANKEQEAPAQAVKAEAPSQGRIYGGETGLVEAALGSEEVRNAVIGDFLQRASKNRSVPIISGGVNVAAQRRTPSSVREAGRLAQQFLNLREK